MKPEHRKLLTLSCVGLSVAVIAIVYRYLYGDDDDTLARGKPKSSSTPTPTTTTTSTSSSTNQQQQQQDKNNDIVDIEELNRQCGFCRPEMDVSTRKAPANSIHEYGRHYFICSGVPADQWPSKFYSMNAQLTALSESIKKYADVQRLPSIFNAVDLASTTPGTYDFIVFPEMVKLIDVTPERIEEIMLYFSQNDSIGDGFPASVEVESITGRHLFVCAHKLKDARCGYCGPILVDQLLQEIEQRRLSSDIKVYGTTHVGGHKFAGNVLVFPPGHWYGYVTSSDVSEVIDSALSGECIKRLHRGSMGQPVIKEGKEGKEGKDSKEGKDHKKDKKEHKKEKKQH